MLTISTVCTEVRARECVSFMMKNLEWAIIRVYILYKLSGNFVNKLNELN